MTTATLTRVTFHRATLAAALASLTPLAKNKRLAVLGCVRIHADGERATLEATDLETRATLTISCDGEGSAILPADLLSKLVAGLRSESVSLEMDGSRVVLRAKGSVAKLTSLPLEDWPPAPEVEEGDTYTLSRDDLRSLARVGFAVSDEDAKPAQKGVYLHPEGMKLRAVGVHGAYLAMREIESGSTFEAIIPETGLSYALRAFGEAPEITIRKAGWNVSLSTDSISVMLRTLEGPFPDYRLVLPKECNHTAVLDRAAWIDSLKRLELIARQGANEKQPPKVRCEFSAEGLRMTAQRDNEIEEVMAVQEYDGDDIRICFDASYLLLILSQMSSKTAEIRLTHPERSVTIYGGEDEGLCLLMPIRDLD